MRRMHGETPPEERPAHQAHPGHQPVPPVEHDHAAMHQDPAMRGAMAFVVRLLDDPEVQRHIHATPDYRETWAEQEVQAHFQMMRRMHGDEPHHH
jgi:hypothetical protein